MAALTFRGDPYRVLDVRPDSDDEAIKRRWRELAREHHPDRAAGDTEATSRLTGRMARINAAYDLLRDPDRRSRFDTSAEGRRAHKAAGTRPRRGAGDGLRFDDLTTGGARDHDRPPSAPPTRPVTARFDTSGLFHARNSRISEGPPPLRGQMPLGSRYRRGGGEDLRASQPNGPVRSRAGDLRTPPPTLEESIDTELEFGKFRGHTLGEVADFEPTYIDWIASTITRDRDLVMRARVVRAEMDRRGVTRRPRPDRSGFAGRENEGRAAG